MSDDQRFHDVPDEEVAAAAGQATLDAPAPLPMQPVQEGERIAALDVLRGFAIFGIFMVNIAFFALPLFSNTDSTSLSDGSDVNQLGWAIVKSLFEYKFVSLFSLMFGIGMVVQLTRAAQRNAPFYGMYIRRLIILMLLGLVHGIALWYGDILFIYSLVGFLMLALIQLSGRALLAIGTAALVLSIAMAVGFLSLNVATTAAPQSEVDASAVEETNQDDESTSESTPDSTIEEPEPPIGSFERFWEAWNNVDMAEGPAGWDEAETIAYSEGPYTAALIMRSISFLGMLVFAGVLGGFGIRVIGMFCLGAALMKLGFFRPNWRRVHRALAFVALPIGLVGEGLCLAIYFKSNFALAWSMVGAEALHAAASVVLCFGYAGLIITIVDLGIFRIITGALACVGRMALTNYLSQTIIATGLMYSWGFGLFGSFNRLQLLGIVVSIFIMQILLSILWLRVFRFGPFEWLWRSLTYWKLQPMRRMPNTT